MNLKKSKTLRFLVITVFITVISFFIFSKTEFFKENYRAYGWEANRLSNQNLQVYSEISDLTDEDYIQFENVEGFKAEKTFNYAKVIWANKDSVSIVPFLYLNSIKLKDIDNYYNREKNELKQVTLSMKDLRKGICDIYFPFFGFEFCGLQLLDSKEKLRLSNINNPKEPTIIFSDLDINESGKFYISMYNLSENLYMMNIKASQDSITFFQKLRFPYRIGQKDSRNSHFAVGGTGWNQNVDTQIEFTVSSDTLSTEFYRYRLSTLDKSTRMFERVN